MQATAAPDTESAQNPLRDYTERTLDRMALIAYPFLVLFGFWHLYLGDYAVAGFMLLITLTIAVRSYRGYKGHVDSTITWAITIELIVGMLVGYASVGTPAAFWSYPLVFVLIFLWPRQQSGPAVILALAILLPAAYIYLDQAVALRLGVTLVMFCYMGYQFVGILLHLQDKLENQAMRDPLTGAYNRRFLMQSLQQAMEEARRGFGSCSLVALDIDNFKSINDSLGHDAGDKVLQNLVSVLHGMRRTIDIVCRTGGEEFIILLRNTAEPGACRFAERLRQSVEKTELLKGQVVTVSIGVAEYHKDETEDHWLNRADVCLYKAKHGGKNQVQPSLALDAAPLAAV